MRQAAQKTSGDNQLLFLPGVFNETLSLLFDAHSYFQSRGAEDQAKVEPAKRDFYTDEVSRVTLRLTSAMAWLMVRRAVYAGRIDEEKASDDYRLDGMDVCMVVDKDALKAMPSYLNYLSSRSLHLYERVHRLDQMVYGNKH